MTPDQINYRLAEAMGLTECSSGEYWINDKNHIAYRTPGCRTGKASQYLLWTPYTDLNQAVMVAEKVGAWHVAKRIPYNRASEPYYAYILTDKPFDWQWAATPAAALSLAIVAFLDEQERTNHEIHP